MAAVNNNNNNNNISVSPAYQNDQSRIHLYWKNVTCKAAKSKLLVNNLSGHLQSGYLTAVLGPSGSGKTTLFECLAKRKISGVTGQVWAASSTNDIKNVRIIYNPQHDHLFSVLTIRESLTYAYELQKYCGRNIDILHHDDVHDDEEEDGVEVVDNVDFCGDRHSTTKTTKNVTNKWQAQSKHNNARKVCAIIHQLGLSQCADVRVSNCSGGQKKRLSIALELIFSPNVLLLDEPTTGLDSVSSLQLVQLLKSLVQAHPVIICASIHQPSAKLFSYFDNLYVISSLGTCIYNGPNRNLLEHMQKYGLTCPIFHNIADFMLETASCLHGEEVVYQLTANELAKPIEDNNKYRVDINVDRTLSKKLATDQFHSSWALLKRSSLITLREPLNYGLRGMGLLMIMAVRLILRDRALTIIDTECFNSTRFAKKILEMGTNSDSYKITSFLSRDIILLITSIMFTVIISLIPSLMLFPLELSIFIKEHSNKWYTRWSYYVSKTLSDIPPTLVFPLIYAIFTYFLVEQPPGLWRFVAYITLIICTSLLAHSYSIVISIFFINNTIAALIFGAMLFVPFFIFSGFIIPINRLPAYVRPFTYASIYKLAIESVLIIYYGFDRCGTSPTMLKMSDFTEYLGGSLLNVSQCITEYTSLPTFDFIIQSFNRDISKINQSIILSRFGLRDIDLIINMSLIVVYILALRLLAYLTLRWKSIAK